MLGNQAAECAKSCRTGACRSKICRVNHLRKTSTHSSDDFAMCWFGFYRGDRR